MISVACQCGKKFRTADSHAGKRARCPACGAALTIPTAAPALGATPAAAPQPVEDDGFSDLASLAAAGPEVFQPASSTAVRKSSGAAVAATASAPASRKSGGAVPSAAAGFAAGARREASGPTAAPAIRMINISPLYILLILGAIVIPAVIYWAKQGPLLAYAQWTERFRIAEDQIPWQICRAITAYYQDIGMGIGDDNGLRYRPKVTIFNFAEPKFMLSLPDKVLFFGTGTEGSFSGSFNPQNWQFEATVSMAGTKHKVTGSASRDDNSLQLDGKKLGVHW